MIVRSGWVDGRKGKMTVKEYLINTVPETADEDAIVVRDVAVCMDGFCLSIQASRAHYCVPRKTIKSGEYSFVEIGRLSEYQKKIETYRSGSVYAYVPIEDVEELIKEHGGIRGNTYD